MINEIQTLEKIKESLIKIFESAQAARIAKVTEQGFVSQDRSQGLRPDLIVDLETPNNKRYRLIVEVKSSGQPRLVRMAINILQTLIDNKPNAYGVFAAPYISEDSQQLCKEADIGFVDMAGNCFLKFGEIYISIEGKKNPYPSSWSLKTLFSAKSSRALRGLLSSEKRDWLTIELAQEVNISLGLASKVKQYLLENELAKGVQEGKLRKFKLTNPEQLLTRWSDEYNYKKNNLNDYYSIEDIKTLERKLPGILSGNDIKYAFSLTSGASFVAPHLRYRRSFVYIESGKINEAAELLKLKRVTSGANVILMEPYDEGVFYGLQDIRGAKVVSVIQLYLDLRNFKERGEEAAEFILQQRIKNRW